MEEHDQECEEYSEACGCESRATLRRQVEVMRTALERIANADHEEEGGPTCSHSEIAEEALKLSASHSAEAATSSPPQAQPQTPPELR